MIYSGKILELTKVLDSIKTKEPISRYISLILKRIHQLKLKPNFPETYNSVSNSILLPDGDSGIFSFDSDKVSLALVFSTITVNYQTKDKTKFLIHPCVSAYFVRENSDFESLQALTGYIPNDEIGSSKAKYISSKAKSAVLRIVKMKPSEIEFYLGSIHTNRSR